MNEQQQLEEAQTPRKLASLQVITAVKNHPNGDALDIVRVLGWDVVTKRDEYKVGDLTVFLEIDSIVPPVDEFAFLANKGYRVKTIRLRGYISQGLCMQPKMLAGSFNFNFIDLRDHYAMRRINEENIDMYGYRDSEGHIVEVLVGDDLTEALGIKKYFKPIPVDLSGTVKGNFPSFVPKTDETRIQSEPQRYDLMKDMPVVITEKLEGTSCTVYWKDGQFGVCSRNWDLEPSEDKYWTTVRRLGLDQCKIDNIAIQGELCGPSIQGNIYKLPQVELFVFRMWDLVSNKMLSHDEMITMCTMLQLKTVPVLMRMQPEQTLATVFPSIDAIMEYTHGPSVLNADTQREGVVFAPLYEVEQGKIGFKAINPDYLL